MNQQKPTKVYFRKGAGFGKALLLLFFIWLVSIFLIYVVFQKQNLTFLTVITLLSFITAFFLHKKTLAVGLLEFSPQKKLILDSLEITLDWKSFDWSFQIEKIKTRYGSSTLGSLKASKKLDHNTHLIFEQTLPIESEIIFRKLSKPAPEITTQTKHYIALKKDLLKLIELTDSNFLKDLTQEKVS